MSVLSPAFGPAAGCPTHLQPGAEVAESGPNVKRRLETFGVMLMRVLCVMHMPSSRTSRSEACVTACLTTLCAKSWRPRGVPSFRSTQGCLERSDHRPEVSCFSLWLSDHALLNVLEAASPLFFLTWSSRTKYASEDRWSWPPASVLSIRPEVLKLPVSLPVSMYCPNRFSCTNRVLKMSAQLRMDVKLESTGGHLREKFGTRTKTNPHHCLRPIAWAVHIPIALD